MSDNDIGANPVEKSDGLKRRLANLRPPFKKGEIHNPTGRPKGTGVSKHLFKLLANIPKGQDMTVGEILARRVVRLALQGDKWALDIILDRTEGKPLQSSEVNLFQSDRPFKNLTDEQIDSVYKLVNDANDERGETGNTGSSGLGETGEAGK